MSEPAILKPERPLVPMVAAPLLTYCAYDHDRRYGGLLGGDGCIYGIPQNASSVIKINPFTDECTLIGSLAEGGHKWHGGNVGPDGNIYGIPCHADNVIKINTASGEVSTIGGPIPAGKHRPDGKYKYLGGVVGSDGAIYCLPSDADYVLRIDCETSEVKCVGRSLEDEIISHTKWQNGFLGNDGCIYGIPLSGQTVIKINCTTHEVTTIGGPLKVCVCARTCACGCVRVCVCVCVCGHAHARARGWEGFGAP